MSDEQIIEMLHNISEACKMRYGTYGCQGCSFALEKSDIHADGWVCQLKSLVFILQRAPRSWDMELIEKAIRGQA